MSYTSAAVGRWPFVGIAKPQAAIFRKRQS
jgi:hypothetical protein